MSRPIKSSVVIAGFNRLASDITEICKKLTEGEKLILCKFISWHKKMAFDTGLRIGLTAHAVRNDKSVITEESQSSSGATGGDLFPQEQAAPGVKP